MCAAKLFLADFLSLGTACAKKDYSLLRADGRICVYTRRIRAPLFTLRITRGLRQILQTLSESKCCPMIAKKIALFFLVLLNFYGGIFITILYSAIDKLGHGREFIVFKGLRSSLLPAIGLFCAFFLALLRTLQKRERNLH